jgi:hypothetical protein
MMNLIRKLLGRIEPVAYCADNVLRLNATTQTVPANWKLYDSPTHARINQQQWRERSEKRRANIAKRKIEAARRGL